MPTVHPTAIVDASAELADDVTVEAYAVIGAGVSVGRGTIIRSHSVLQGTTVIGEGCRIGPAAYVGLDGQHLEFMGRPEADRRQTWLVVGDNVIIRETASVHRATKPGREKATRLDNNVMIMASAHVAHDCVIGEHAVLAHGSMLGGHVTIGPRAFIGGGSAIHQFDRVGRLAIVGGNQVVSREVPPFAAMFQGALKGYNAVGCKRSGMSREAIHSLRAAFHCYHTHRTMPAALAAIAAKGLDTPEVREVVEFIKTAKRGIPPSARFVHYSRAGNSDDGE